MGNDLFPAFFSCNSLPAVYNAFHKIFANSLSKDVSWRMSCQPAAEHHVSARGLG